MSESTSVILPSTQPSRRKSLGDTRHFIILLGALTTFAAMGGCKQAPAPEAPVAVSSAAQAPAGPPAVPFTKKHIYDEDVDPHKDIAAALKQAKREHKRVLLDFGGDWCGDCQVLDIYFHQSPNDELLRKNFVLVHVFIGRMDKNLDVPEKYAVPVKKGVPALAVVDATGKTLYSQQSKEFEDMRHMEASSVTDFLKKWKG